MNRKEAKPFLKWAGGKSQLLKEIEARLPNNINQQDFSYFEPFLGSGAVLFWFLNNFNNLKYAVVNDINSDLINTYNVIKNNPEKLANKLLDLQNEFHSLDIHPENKKSFYYNKRELYNSKNLEPILNASLFIFLNRTCFNGLYRVNSKGAFNVPLGSYKNPTICDYENIMTVSELIQKVIFLNGDYAKTLEYRTENNFFYFDPPYKPLSESSSFNSYSKDEFNDSEQIRLKGYCDTLNNLGDSWMLSNSDVKGFDETNNFFDDLYANYNIKRVLAKRLINSKSEKRGQLTELLITNY